MSNEVSTARRVPWALRAWRSEFAKGLGGKVVQRNMVREPHELAETQLAVYGYKLTTAGEILSKAGTMSGVFVSFKKRRFYCRLASNALIYSGPELGTFVERFWFAKRLPR